jgi:hypothetical protein
MPWWKLKGFGIVSRILNIYFIRSAGALLIITAVAKFISACGSARILENGDPILVVPFRYVFLIVGALELTIAFTCFFSRRVGLSAKLVAWLSTNFAFYHLGLLWVGYQRPCSCLGLGNLTDALHIPPQTADTAMKIILAYLLIGSYTSLFWLWRQRKKAVSASLPTQ